MLDIIKAHAIRNLCYIKSQKMTPKGIVVHSTGANNPNLKRYVDAPERVGANQYGNHWNTAKPNGREVCVHAFIGYDKDKQVRVAEILPLNICCWGVGSGATGSYNFDPPYIQFEICEDGLFDRDYYNKAFTVAAEYCAKLCKTYDLDTSKIVGHCEAYRQGYGSNHSDPEHWMKNFGENMDTFRAKVADFIKQTKDDSSVEFKENTIPTKIYEGDLIAISKNATYYNGNAIPSWVKNQKWYVKSQPIGDRVVIDKNEDGTNSICSAINAKFLTVLKSSRKQNLPSGENGCPYRVKVSTSCLNIRQAAGSDTKKVGAIIDEGVYTIVEEKQGVGATMWGRLKSGIGWISLDYVKKL